MFLLQSQYAREFAEELGREMIKAPLIDAQRAAPEQHEHKTMTPYVTERLERFLQARNIVVPEDRMIVDCEGNRDRKPGTPSYGYPVLGTSTYPDIAVLAPFTCAVEFDREARSASEFRTKLMKAAVHVLSGAYSACLYVYLQPQGSTIRYTDDGSLHTKRLLMILESFGLFVCLVPAQDVTG